MLCVGEIGVAVRCPECGKLEVRRLSRFAIGRNGRVEFSCRCGALLLAVSARGGGRYLVEIPCVVCVAPHQNEVAGREIWGAGIAAFHCPETGLVLAHLGRPEQLEEAACPAPEANGGEATFFQNPEIMYQVLSRIYGMADGGLITCGCGCRWVEVTIFPDRVQLACRDCGASRVVRAVLPEDVSRLRRMRYLRLSSGERQAPNVRPRRKRP
ncbi:MAG: hypothetical protein H5T97_11105 [Firmicutes bacterium]|nr:hypothetical protein [Bacillota bacterium]